MLVGAMLRSNLGDKCSHPCNFDIRTSRRRC